MGAKRLGWIKIRMQDVQTGTEQLGVEVEAWGGLVLVLVRGQRPREEQVMGGQWVWKSENKGEVGERLCFHRGAEVGPEEEAVAWPPSHDSY